MELRIQFARRPDGNVILRCTRKDNSVTWQRYDKHSAFFALHDLTHFAVETVLGLHHGFFGLLADGWDITDTSSKEKRSALPVGSLVAEQVVGLFSGERSGGAPPLSAAAFNANIEQMTGLNLEQPFTELQLTAVRNRIADLHRQWAATPPGATFDLIYEES